MTEIKTIDIDNLTFQCRISGDPENELVLFLHGFPETSIMWRQVMEELTSHGFYCLAPDMRGYSEGACPKGIKNYTIDKLRQDILGIAHAEKKDSFHLIGHDWGAIVGWSIVHYDPSKIISWSALSVPHPSAFRKAYKFDEEQKKKSKYIGFFLLPFLPELILRSGDFSRFRRLWKRSTSEELEDYLSVFRRKGTLRASLNYYRANIGKGKGERIGEIGIPSLFIWGNRDLAVSAAAAQANHEYMKGEYTFLEVDGGHWLIQSNFEEVKNALVEHLEKKRLSSGAS